MEKMCPKKIKAKRKMLEMLKKQSGNSPEALEGIGVSIMAKDKESLKEGLDKAKELLEEKKLKALFDKKYKR